MKSYGSATSRAVGVMQVFVILMTSVLPASVTWFIYAGVAAMFLHVGDGSSSSGGMKPYVRRFSGDKGDAN